ncbi:unnamed protein product [Rotaria sp. Silwood2]|nr:unnamed protein product [Rotaria sp. Silwood2]CAF4431932.1 unnamed protein product [Rotaria sp. Silwood2]
MSKGNVNIRQDQSHVQPTLVVNEHPLNSLSTSIRRTLSYDTEDDFTLVKNKNKNKKIKQNEKKYDGTKFSTNTITNNDNVDDQQQYSSTSDICLTKHSDNDNNINVSNVNTINNDNKITMQSERYATTRYPFAPFIVRFHVTNINEQKVVEELIDFVK